MDNTTKKEDLFETSIAASVGPRITNLRKEKNLSVNKLANMTGVSQSYLRDVELKNKNPTINFLSLICESLEISLRDFFDIPSDLTQKTNEDIEEELTKRIKKLSLTQQRCLLDFLDAL